MKRAARIRIYGIQQIDGEEEQQEIVTEGEYYVRDGKHFLLYEETLEDGRNVRTLIKDNLDYVEVLKSGYVHTRMRFLEGTYYESEYKTPMGSLSLKTETKRIDRNLMTDEMCWELHYSVIMDGHHISDNVLKIEVNLKKDCAR